MHAFTYLTFLAGFALAQRVDTIFWPYNDRWPVTFVGASAETSTYGYACSSGNIGQIGLQSSLLSAQASATITPAPTVTPSVHQQTRTKLTKIPDNFCISYAITQAPSSYLFNFADPDARAFSLQLGCSWKGQMSTADLSCTEVRSGSAVDKTELGTTTITYKADDKNRSESTQTVTVTGVSETSLNTVAPTVTGVSGTPSKTGVSMKTGNMAPAKTPVAGSVGFAAGVAGILAVAL